MERRSNAPLWASLRVGLQPGRGITLAEINTLLDALGVSRVLTSYNSFTRARSRALGNPTRSTTYGVTKDAWKRQLREELTAWGLWDLEPAELSKALGTLVIESAQEGRSIEGSLGMDRSTARLNRGDSRSEKALRSLVMGRTTESSRSTENSQPKKALVMGCSTADFKAQPSKGTARLKPRADSRSERTLGTLVTDRSTASRDGQLNRAIEAGAAGISFSDSPFETVDFEFDDIEWDTRFTPYYDYGFGQGYGPDYDWDLD